MTHPEPVDYDAFAYLLIQAFASPECAARVRAHQAEQQAIAARVKAYDEHPDRIPERALKALFRSGMSTAEAFAEMKAQGFYKCSPTPSSLAIIAPATR